MNDDVILNKIATIEKCIQRIHEEYDGAEKEFATNFTKQDAVILNIQRLCEAAIDVGTYVIRLKRLGIPQSSRDIFVLLANAKVISEELSKKMQAMVGFRNIAVNDYKKLSLPIVTAIINEHLGDFLEFAKAMLQQ